MISAQVIHFVSLIPIRKHIDEGIKSKKIIDPKALSSMIEQQVKKAASHKGKEADIHMVDKAPERPRVITNPLPPHQEGNVNVISRVEERILDFSSPSLPWKATLRTLAQESHITLEDIGASGFDWEINSFCDSGDRHPNSIIECFEHTLSSPSAQAGTSHNAMLVGSREDWDEYLQEHLCKIPLEMRMPASQTSVVIEEIIESPVDSGAPAPKKG
ncbi:hypothetical protein SO802_006444 [Lithocarpus litseifolius]|uniref:Uncharacterized protein n=1 Tax=Lithocarpus litseifolius TaxID=425828 RepID=A0AAW2DLP3_9ROSI